MKSEKALAPFVLFSRPAKIIEADWYKSFLHAVSLAVLFRRYYGHDETKTVLDEFNSGLLGSKFAKVYVVFSQYSSTLVGFCSEYAYDSDGFNGFFMVYVDISFELYGIFVEFVETSCVFNGFSVVFVHLSRVDDHKSTELVV